MVIVGGEVEVMALVFIDVDGTLTDVSSPWQDIHELHRLWDTRGIPIAEQWMSGAISYDDFCRLDVDLWNEIGLTLEEIHQRFDQYPIRPQAAEAISLLLGHNHTPVLLSTGFTYIGQRILAGLNGADRPRMLANHLYKAGPGKLAVTVNVSGDKGSSRCKAAHVRSICAQSSVQPERAFAIGDGPSDKHMFDACGKGFLVSNGDELLRAVSKIIKDDA